MKTKGLVLALVTLMVLSFILSLVGCSSQSPATSSAPSKSPAPAQTTAPATTSAPASKPATSTTAPSAAGGKTIKFAFDQPPKGAIAEGWNWLAQEFPKRTNGRYKIDLYPAQALVKTAEQLNAVVEGIADVTDISLSSQSQAFPVSSVTALPSVSFPDTEAGHLASENAQRYLTEKYPAFSGEFKKFQILFYHTSPANLIMTGKKKVVVPSDLKGLKIASQGKDMDIISMAGGTPVNMVPPNVYEAMDKSVIEGSLVGWYHIISQHFEEVGKFYLDHTFSQLPHRVLMNLNTWNSMSSEDQKILFGMAKEVESTSTARHMRDLEQGRKIALDKGCTIVTLTPEQKKLWQDLVKPMDDKWLADMKSKGVTDAPAILDDLKRLCAEAWSKNK